MASGFEWLVHCSVLLKAFLTSLVIQSSVSKFKHLYSLLTKLGFFVLLFLSGVLVLHFKHRLVLHMLYLITNFSFIYYLLIRDREERLAALTAAQQEAMEELQKKIQLKVWKDTLVEKHINNREFLQNYFLCVFFGKDVTVHCTVSWVTQLYKRSLFRLLH